MNEPNAIIKSIVTVLASLLEAVILKFLWEWFVVPFGVIPLSIPHALGISILIGYFKVGSVVKDTCEDSDPWWQKTCVTIVAFLLLWGTGYVLQMLM